MLLIKKLTQRELLITLHENLKLRNISVYFDVSNSSQFFN